MFKQRLTKPEAGNPYYNRIASGGYSGAIQGSPVCSGCDVLANCVGYVAGRFNEIIGKEKMQYLQYPPDAEDFIDVAKQQGLKTGTEPQVGAIIVWAKGDTWNPSDGSGHVAVVEEVRSDGSIITSESGYGCASPFWISHRYKETGNWGAGPEYKFLGFIYQPNYESDIPEVYVKKGDKGSNVKWVQNKLADKGYLRPTEVDADFGKITLGGVCAFQLESGLVVDGICGPETMKKLAE